MSWTNQGDFEKLISALDVLGLCADYLPKYSAAKRRYHQLLTSEEDGHWMDHRIFSAAWHTVKDHLALHAVQEKILDVADFFLLPTVHDFEVFVEVLGTSSFGGEQGPALNELFRTVVHYERARWQDFSVELEEYSQCSLPEARRLLIRLLNESYRLELVLSDLYLMERMCKTMQSGRMVPKRSGAVMVFRYWHEARKRDDTTELELLSKQAYSQTYNQAYK